MMVRSFLQLGKALLQFYLIPLTLALASCASPRQPETTQSVPEHLQLAVPSGETLEFQRYPADGEKLLIWVSSERGQGEAERSAALELANRGVEVWMLDLGFNYFLESGRKGFDQIPSADIQALINKAEEQKRPVVFAIGRAAVPMLKAYGFWKPDEDRPKHLDFLLMHPNLYDEAEALQEVRYLNLGDLRGARLMIVQPRRSAGVVWLDQQRKSLESQGAEVNNEILERLREGFWARQEPTEYEMDMGQHLADMVWARFPREK